MRLIEKGWTQRTETVPIYHRRHSLLPLKLEYHHHSVDGQLIARTDDHRSLVL